MRDIPFFPYAELFRADAEGLLETMRATCDRGAFILQRECAEFEEALARMLGIRHVIGVANGTDAIILGLKAAGIGPGDEVILPSHTYIATAASVHWVGAVPVLAECGADHMLDPADIEHRITPRTRAVMPVQLNGRTCDMAAIGDIARRHGLMVFEDAAQAVGSRFDGRAAGGFGRFGTFSFYPAKLLGAFGDAGAVTTNDDEIARRVRLLRDHGRDENGQVVAWGINSRLDNLQAAVLLRKLADLPAQLERRRAIARRYHDALAALPQLTLPPPPGADARHHDVFQNYEIEADRRDALREHLAADGVRTIVQWGGTPVHRFRQLGFESTLPRTEKIFERCLLLPMNAALRDDDADHIAESIRRFYANS